MKKIIKSLIILFLIIAIQSCSDDNEVKIIQEPRNELINFEKLVKEKLCAFPELELLIRNSQTGEIILEKYQNEESKNSKSTNCDYYFNLPQVDHNVDVWPYVWGGVTGDIDSDLLQPTLQYILDYYILNNQGIVKISPVIFAQDDRFDFYSSNIPTLTLTPSQVNSYAEEILCQILDVKNIFYSGWAPTRFLENSRIFSANVDIIDGTICSGEVGIIGHFYLGHQK